jgi:hypothetical protein
MRRLVFAFISLCAMLLSIAGASAAQTPTRPAKRPKPYFVGNFNTCDFSQWHMQGPRAAFKIVRTPKVEGACAAAVTIGPWAVNGLVNPDADGAALWLMPAPYGTAERTVWQHFSVQFAQGYQAVPGHWNAFIEWHNDGGWQRFPRSQIPFEYANLLWTVCYRNGPPKIEMRIVGGRSVAPRTVRVFGPRVRTGHWYDFLARTVWSPDPSKGMVEWWLDGRRLYSHHVSNLYTRPDGTVSTVYFIEDHYRRHADSTTTIFFDGTRLGPTRSSVRYKN